MPAAAFHVQSAPFSVLKEGMTYKIFMVQIPPLLDINDPDTRPISTRTKVPTIGRVNPLRGRVQIPLIWPARVIAGVNRWRRTGIERMSTLDFIKRVQRMNEFKRVPGKRDPSFTSPRPVLRCGHILVLPSLVSRL
jgi:hypothetical protein